MKGVVAEHDIQKLIVGYLDLVLPSDQRIVGIPNNPRSKISGAFEKARGTRAGFPDLLLAGRIVGVLEVKRPGQRLRAEQQEWAGFCFASGMKHAVVHSIDDVRCTMLDWGVKISERVHL